MQCSAITLEIALCESVLCHCNGRACGARCGEKGDEGVGLDTVGLSTAGMVKQDRKRQRSVERNAD